MEWNGSHRRTTVEQKQNTNFLLAPTVFEGGIYFIGKPVQRRQNKIHAGMRNTTIGLIDAGSTTYSLSVLLSAVETSLQNTKSPRDNVTQWASVAIASTWLHACSCTTYTSCSYYLRTAFILFGTPNCAATGVYFIRSSQMCSYYLSVSSKRRNIVIMYVYLVNNLQQSHQPSKVTSGSNQHS